MRLIDADKFKGKVIASHTGSGVIKLIAINDVPTAYDLDKVAEKLQKISDEAHDLIIVSDSPQYYDGYEDGVDKAIEIVKGGGSDLALECKWKLEDEEANLYVTGCKEYHLLDEGTPEENKYRYCPYCGKKIREAVV